MPTFGVLYGVFSCIFLQDFTIYIVPYRFTAYADFFLFFDNLAPGTVFIPATQP
jgi:hypothetical protein